MSRHDGHEYEKTINKLNKRMDLSGNKNWLGHRLNTATSGIDEMLFNGSTVKQMVKKCRTTEDNISRHLSHLRTEHGIPIKDESGKIMIDYKEVKKRIDSMKPRRSMKPIFEK